MALKKCLDCGKEVSGNAKACPHCGSTTFDLAHAIGEAGNAMMGCGCLLILLGGALMLVLFL